MKRFIFVLICTVLTVISLSACDHEHEYGEWTTVTDSTCTEEGEKTRSCKDCGETESAAVEKKSHTTTQIPELYPTCSSQGYTKGTYCTACASYIEEPVPIPPTHTYAPSALSAPTCTADGINLYTCTTCKASYTENVSALGHDYAEATCTTPRTCNKCNSIEGVALGHTTIMGTCGRCNVFIYPTVSLPDFPINTSNNVLYCLTTLKITEMKYRFTTNTVTFTFSAEKIADAGSLENGKFFCGFSYRLYDKNGNLITANSYAINDLAVGDKVTDRTITIELPDKISDTYLLVIDDYE